jgi:hypothetical protein
VPLAADVPEGGCALGVSVGVAVALGGGVGVSARPLLVRPHLLVIFSYHKMVVLERCPIIPTS